MSADEAFAPNAQMDGYRTPRLPWEEAGEEPTEKSVDPESIAFSVMYNPRVRQNRTDLFNCDTRLLREGELLTKASDAAAGAALDFSLKLGFVSDDE